jgi:hypothetical protein
MVRCKVTTGQGLRFPGGGGPQLAHEGGKVASPTYHPPLLPKEDTSGTYLCEMLSRPQGHRAAGRIMSIKKPNPLPSGS